MAIMEIAMEVQEEKAVARISLKPSTKTRLRRFAAITGYSYDEVINRFLDNERREGETLVDAAVRIQQAEDATG